MSNSFRAAPWLLARVPAGRPVQSPAGSAGFRPYLPVRPWPQDARVIASGARPERRTAQPLLTYVRRH